MLQSLIKNTLSVAVIGMLTAAAHADVTLPAIISDNMLLQSSKPDLIWGTATPGEKVTVSFLGQTADTLTDADGNWKLALKPLKAGDTGDLQVKANNTLTVHNVLVGSVWVCSGQSNMQFGVGVSHNATVEIPKANYPKIRLFSVARISALKPQHDVEVTTPTKTPGHGYAGTWTECTPETLIKHGDWSGFSAVGYYFGRDLHEATGVPIGLIHSNWGGTPAQAWTTLETLEKNPAFHGYVTAYHKYADELPKQVAAYPKDLAAFPEAHKEWQEKYSAEAHKEQKDWEDATKAAKAAGTKPPEKLKLTHPEPRRPNDPARNTYAPSTLYNGMIAPLTNYAIEGTIWYQGESNAGQAVEYRTLFPTMIADWRSHWKQAGYDGDFPFLFVQLASFMKRAEQPTDGGWPWLREAQLMTLSLPNTAMAVTIDIGEENDIHPKNKSEVGHRLALAAEKMVYGKDIVASGPLYQSMAIEGNAVRLTFANTGGGLVIAPAPPIRLDQKPAEPATDLKGFAIAGEDKKFVWAQAKIDGQTLLVSSPDVPKPVAVRYAWGNNPECNLYNKELLPASPFRTDTWGESKK